MHDLSDGEKVVRSAMHDVIREAERTRALSLLRECKAFNEDLHLTEVVVDLTVEFDDLYLAMKAINESFTFLADTLASFKDPANACESLVRTFACQSERMRGGSQPHEIDFVDEFARFADVVETAPLVKALHHAWTVAHEQNNLQNEKRLPTPTSAMKKPARSRSKKRN